MPKDGLRVASRGVSKTQKRKQSTGGYTGLQLHRGQFGQHLLRNPMVVQAIVDKSGVQPTDTVLEIGPGTGNLTVKLLEKARRVIAVEADPRMVLELQRRVQDTEMSSKLTIVQGDIARVDLPYFDICVANIPYKLSSVIVFRLLGHRPPPRAAVLMVQREFAMRLVAQPADPAYSRLSVSVQFLARVHHLLKVARNNFRPPPNVDSSVVRIEPRRPLPPIDYRDWNGLLRHVYRFRNKTLSSIFRMKYTLRVMDQNRRVYQAASMAGGGGGRGGGDAVTEEAILKQMMELELNEEMGGGGGGGRGGGVEEGEGEGEGEGEEEEGGEDVEDMDAQYDTPQGSQPIDIQYKRLMDLKTEVLQLLDDIGLAHARPKRMGQMDLLTLLAALTKAGIFFK